MNLPLRIGYEGAAHLARALAAVAPASRNKLLQTFAARRGVRARYASFSRPRDRPLLWMHAPSVGEGLQARPVLELFRANSPETLSSPTRTSPRAPSASRARSTSTSATCCPSIPAATRVPRLAALSPTALVFSKLDVWPNLVRESSRGAYGSGSSARRSPPAPRARGGFAARLLRDAYARLDRVGAISDDDAERLVSLGVPAGAVSVTGDTRYDQVWARAVGVDRDGPLIAPLRSERVTLVAGSTWPADERPLLAAWARAARSNPHRATDHRPARADAGASRAHHALVPRVGAALCIAWR